MSSCSAREGVLRSKEGADSSHPAKVWTEERNRADTTFSTAVGALARSSWASAPARCLLEAVPQALRAWGSARAFSKQADCFGQDGRRMECLDFDYFTGDFADSRHSTNTTLASHHGDLRRDSAWRGSYGQRCSVSLVQAWAQGASALCLRTTD